MRKSPGSLATARPARGVALVMTLCALVLITVLLVAFFSKAQINRQVSFSSTNISKSSQLARTVGHMILGELRQEIVESSIALQGDPAAPNPSYAKVYQVKTGYSSTPMKMGVSLPPAIDQTPEQKVAATTVSKVSAPGVGVRPSSTVVGSDVSIGEPSLNGRKFTISKWFQTGGPQLGEQSALPTWIYVTRGGPKNPAVADAKTNGSNDFVIGRYAYTIYDVSGRLDANVAGYPAAAQANAGSKGSVAYANLSELDPALFTTGPGGTIDSFVKWRNGDSANTAVDYETFLNDFSGPEGGIVAVNAIPNQFQQQRFVSRRDLLNSANETFVGKLPGAPEMFTHFSRASAGPSWAPEKDASEYGGSSDPSYQYKTNAEKSDAVNRNIANVRYNAGGTLTRYLDDGSSETVTVAAGDPLVSRRFSLAKLAWLGHDGPNTTAFPNLTAQAIRDCFGLTWNSTSRRWDYAHGDSSKILTLDQVQAQQREPDFFELLKAGILSGSLGNHPGPVAAASDAVAGGPAGMVFDYVSESKDRHILQIGANIIDQADADNYPTAVYQHTIYRNGFDFQTAYGTHELFNTVFGQENLPMLQRVALVIHKRDGDETAVGQEDIWMQPEVWNPHESSTADPANFPLTPQHLRVVTYGGTGITITETNNYTYTYVIDPGPPVKNKTVSIPSSKTKITNIEVDFGDDPLNPNLAGIVSFINPKPGTKRGKGNPADALFDTPKTLAYSPNTTKDNYQDVSQQSGLNNFYYYDMPPPWSTARCLGVWLGKFERDPRISDHPLAPSDPPPDPAKGYPTHKVEVIPLDSPGEPHLTFVLEYLDNNNVWRPYSMMGRIQEIRPSTFSYKHPCGEPSPFLDFDGARPDPRTDRFSASAGHLNSSGTTYNYMWGFNTSIRTTPKLSDPGGSGGGRGGLSYMIPATTAGFHFPPPIVKKGLWDAFLLDDWAQNIKDPVRAYYADPDGVVRPGDSVRADYAESDAVPGSGEGAMLYNAAQLTPSAQRRRPVILNRPFRSAAELGYVYRDQPFKTLDLWSSSSADVGLLSLFAATESTSDLTAGKVNVGSASPEILRAVLAGTAKQHAWPAVLPAATDKIIQSEEASALALGIAEKIAAEGALLSDSDLATRLGSTFSDKFTNSSSAITLANQANKGWAESPLRSLSSVNSTRDWNLLIDLTAQVGQIPRQAQDLKDFIVEGERRYWLHVSIDRTTGKITDTQWETVE